MAGNKLKIRLKTLLSKPENQTCCDCSDRKPTWATIIVPPPDAPKPMEKIGAFCCFQCSGAHRGLGTHICFVRSVNLDECKFKTEQSTVAVDVRNRTMNDLILSKLSLKNKLKFLGKEVEVLAMERGGNMRINKIFEATILNEFERPHPRSDMVARERYIREKYEERKYYDPTAFVCLDETNLPSVSPDKTELLRPKLMRHLSMPMIGSPRFFKDEKVQFPIMTSSTWESVESLHEAPVKTTAPGTGLVESSLQEAETNFARSELPTRNLSRSRSMILSPSCQRQKFRSMSSRDLKVNDSLGTDIARPGRRQKVHVLDDLLEPSGSHDERATFFRQASMPTSHAHDGKSLKFDQEEPTKKSQNAAVSIQEELLLLLLERDNKGRDRRNHQSMSHLHASMTFIETKTKSTREVNFEKPVRRSQVFRTDSEKILETARSVRRPRSKPRRHNSLPPTHCQQTFSESSQEVAPSACGNQMHSFLGSLLEGSSRHVLGTDERTFKSEASDIMSALSPVMERTVSRARAPRRASMPMLISDDNATLHSWATEDTDIQSIQREDPLKAFMGTLFAPPQPRSRNRSAPKRNLPNQLSSAASVYSMDSDIRSTEGIKHEPNEKTENPKEKRMIETPSAIHSGTVADTVKKSRHNKQQKNRCAKRKQSSNGSIHKEELLPKHVVGNQGSAIKTLGQATLSSNLSSTPCCRSGTSLVEAASTLEFDDETASQGSSDTQSSSETQSSSYSKTESDYEGCSASVEFDEDISPSSTSGMDSFVMRFPTLPFQSNDF